MRLGKILERDRLPDFDVVAARVHSRAQCRAFAEIDVRFSVAFHKELLTFTASAQRASGFLLMVSER